MPMSVPGSGCVRYLTRVEGERVAGQEGAAASEWAFDILSPHTDDLHVAGATAVLHGC